MKSGKTDEMSVYKAGVLCSAMAWVFPLIHTVAEMNYPVHLAIPVYVGSLLFLSASSWAGVGAAIGVTLATLLAR